MLNNLNVELKDGLPSPAYLYRWNIYSKMMSSVEKQEKKIVIKLFMRVNRYLRNSIGLCPVVVHIQFSQPDSMWQHVEQAELSQEGSVCGYREDTNTAFRWLTTINTRHWSSRQWKHWKIIALQRNDVNWAHTHDLLRSTFNIPILYTCTYNKQFSWYIIFL